MPYLAILASLVIWPIICLVEFVCLIVGIVVCGVLTIRERYEWQSSNRYSGRVVLAWAPSWARLWGNDEDGIDGNPRNASDGKPFKNFEWAASTKSWPEWRTIFVWSALRNSVGNLRYVFPFGIQIDPARIRSVGNSRSPEADHALIPGQTFWFFCWQFPFAGLWVIWHGIQVRAGWKILPSDADGLDASDPRGAACGTGWQIQTK